jgi:diacylglycerol kinase
MKKSFLFAFRGFSACLRTERNFRFHLAVTFYVLIGGVILNITTAEWLAVLLCVGAVLGAEIFNTAIEKVCDALHPGQSAAIGLAKDMAAGAVLMFALISAAVGGIIFFRTERLRQLVAFVRANPLPAIVLALTVPCALYFVFRSYANDKSSHHHHRRPSKRR